MLFPAPPHCISKKTIRVVVFHRRRSSHLFYTPYVFSQCQTRVKLNQLCFVSGWTGMSPFPSAMSQIPASSCTFPCRLERLPDALHCGCSTPVHPFGWDDH